MKNYFTINIEDPPAEYFPLPYQKRIENGVAGPVESTTKPLRQGEDTGKVYWDAYINAIIQKALADQRTHESEELWSGGSLFYFPPGKYHLIADIHLYHTDPASPHFGQAWTNINVRGEGSASKIIAEGKRKIWYWTGFCNDHRRESAAGAWLKNLWTQNIDFVFGLDDEDLQRMHGGTGPQHATHGIWSFYIDQMYIHTGGVLFKRISSDIGITGCTFDYGERSIEIRDQVYTITIQNNHFWNQGQRLRLVHSTKRYNWKQYFDELRPSQREGYQRGGLILITANRDNSPGTSDLPPNEGAFHIEGCDNVIFTNNFSVDARQPIDLPAGHPDDHGGYIRDNANFCKGRGLTIRNCCYVQVAHNIFGGYWPKNGGVVELDQTRFANITHNIITPVAGMNRQADQLDEAVCKQLPPTEAIRVDPSCVRIQVQGNTVESLGPFQSASSNTQSGLGSSCDD